MHDWYSMITNSHLDIIVTRLKKGVQVQKYKAQKSKPKLKHQNGMRDP